MDLGSAGQFQVHEAKVITRSALMGNATHVSYIIKLGFWYHRSTHGSVKVALSALFVVCKVKLIYKVEVGNANWVAYWLRVLIVVDAVLKSLHRLVRPHGIGVSPVLSSEDLIIKVWVTRLTQKMQFEFLIRDLTASQYFTSQLCLGRPRGFEIRTVQSSARLG